MKDEIRQVLVDSMECPADGHSYDEATNEIVKIFFNELVKLHNNSKIMYASTKLFSGYSTTFRQWRAKDSHCRFLHGYALEFKVTFKALTLDDKNWVMDFGGFKAIKRMLESLFDHTTLIAYDDPCKKEFEHLQECGIIQPVFLPDVGCEKFAEYIFNQIVKWMEIVNNTRVTVYSVECIENRTNSAIFYGK